MRRRVLVVGLVVLAMGLVLGATSASAFTTSNITSPASGTLLFSMPNKGDTLMVTGTTNGSGNADILCVSNTHPTYFYDYRTLATNVTVSSNAFSTTLTAVAFNLPYAACSLHAVPTGTKPADLSPYTGPNVIGINRWQSTLTSGPNSGALYDFFFADQQSPGYNDFFSISSCGLCDSRLLTDPVNYYSSTYLFFGNDALYNDERLSSNNRGYAMIDGHNAVFSDGAFAINPSGSGFPPLTMTSSFAANGDMTITEDENAVRCPTDALPYTYEPSGTNACTPGFLPTGVHLHRTILQTAGGTVDQFVDVYSSTDNAVHNINFDFDQYFNDSTGPNPPAYEPSMQFPWVSGVYGVHAKGDLVAAPPSAPVSMFIRGNSTVADGDQYYPQGAITFSPAPSGFTFLKGPYEFVSNYQRQIPAGGSITIRQTFSIGTTQAAVAALAAQAEDQQDTPVVSISAPANGSTVSTPGVTVTGTAVDRVISSLTVNGHAVTPGAGGAFSVPVTLNLGANTITVTAKDGQGNQGSASVSVTYVPPKLALVGGLLPSNTGVAFSMTCQAAAGAICTGAASMTTLETLVGKTVTGLAARKRKRSSKRVVVGTTTFSIPAGKTLRVVVPLNSTGRKLLAKFKRLPVTVTARLNTNPPFVLTSKTTLKPKKHKHKKKKKH